MTPVHPSTKTTLVLSAAFQPIGFFSARSAMRNLVVGAVKAYDQYGNIHDWSSWIGHDNDLAVDHPSMRSVDSEWAIPTIVVIPGYFNARKFGKRRRTIKLRQLYNLYDRTCVYCTKEMPYSQATRDHVFPRSKGGSNNDDNLVLSCKKCNLKKSDKFPYFNKFGHTVKPKVLSDIDFIAATENVTRRPEWVLFLGEKVDK